jgi:hypothetical protein
MSRRKRYVRFVAVFTEGGAADLFVEVPPGVTFKNTRKLRDLAWDQLEDDGIDDQVEQLTYVGPAGPELIEAA